MLLAPFLVALAARIAKEGTNACADGVCDFTLRFFGVQSLSLTARAIRHELADGIVGVSWSSADSAGAGAHISLQAWERPSEYLGYTLARDHAASGFKLARGQMRMLASCNTSDASDGPQALDVLIEHANVLFIVGQEKYACPNMTIGARRAGGWWLASRECKNEVLSRPALRCKCGLHFTPTERSDVIRVSAPPLEHFTLAVRTPHTLSFAPLPRAEGARGPLVVSFVRNAFLTDGRKLRRSSSPDGPQWNMCDLLAGTEACGAGREPCDTPPLVGHPSACHGYRSRSNLRGAPVEAMVRGTLTVSDEASGARLECGVVVGVHFSHSDRAPMHDSIRWEMAGTDACEQLRVSRSLTSDGEPLQEDMYLCACDGHDDTHLLRLHLHERGMSFDGQRAERFAYDDPHRRRIGQWRDGEWVGPAEGVLDGHLEVELIRADSINRH